MLDSLREDVRAAVERDPAATRPAEAVMYAGVHAVWAHRLAHWLHSRGFRLTARFVSQVARLLTGVEIHPAADLGRRVFIDHGMGVVIGETAEVGDDVLMYHGVTLGGTANDPVKRHPTVGDRVTLGAGATLLGPIEVEDDATVGAGSVVTDDVPAGATVAGVPARVVASSSGEEGGADGGEGDRAEDEEGGGEKEAPDEQATADDD